MVYARLNTVMTKSQSFGSSGNGSNSNFLKIKTLIKKKKKKKEHLTLSANLIKKLSDTQIAAKKKVVVVKH